MRLLLGLLCCFYLLEAEISKYNISVFMSKDGLKINLPTQAKFTSKQSLDEIVFYINEPWKGVELSQALSYPFKSLSIKAQENQTILSLQSQTNISYSYSKDKNGLNISFWVNSSLSWWRYGLVLGIMIGLVVLLLYIKKKQKIHSSNNFKMTQDYLSKDCKIITLNNGEKKFVIFSSDKGCVLLDSKDYRKDFTPKEG